MTSFKAKRIIKNKKKNKNVRNVIYNITFPKYIEVSIYNIYIMMFLSSNPFKSIFLSLDNNIKYIRCAYTYFLKIKLYQAQEA